MVLRELYVFEGKMYTEINLSGLADLTTMQEIAAENSIAKQCFLIVENSCNYLYLCVVSAMATHLSDEFFVGLPIGELFKLKRLVNNSAFFE